MPPNDTPAPTQQASNRKRAAVERVVPAIPLPLSKPRLSKVQPKVEADAKAGAEDVAHEVQPVASRSRRDEEVVPATNGESAPSIDEVKATLENTISMEDAVTMPTNADTPGSRGSAAMSLSFGGTPELPATESVRPSTPPQQPPQVPSSTTSPTSLRKSRESFDMRQIRTELPPAFVPAAGQHTPNSSTSSQFQRPLNLNTNAHTQHARTNTIVFGGQDSSTTSPVPPQSAGSAFASPTHPSFGPTQQRYFIPHSHAHHNSETHAQRSYHPGYPQSSLLWNPRQAYSQHTSQPPMYHQHNQAYFRYPPRDIFTPPDSQPVNGRRSRSRSASRTSSIAAPNRQSPLNPDTISDGSKTIVPSEPRASFRNPAHPRPPQYQPQMPPPQFQQSDVNASFGNAEAIRDHALNYFGDPTFVDCQMHITDDGGDGQQDVDGHRLILSRSPRLLKLLNNSRASFAGSSLSQVSVELRGHYLRTKTFLDAVKYLYGGPLLQLDYERPGSAGGEHIPSNVDRMNIALQNIATGAWLEVQAIAMRGVEVACGLLHWETVATAIAFALEGGLSQVWTVDDGSEDPSSSSSSNEDSPNRPETMAFPTYDPFSTHLLHRIILFIVNFFPINFYLNTAAPQLDASPRLLNSTSNHESRPSRSDPRLSQIRFGEIPAGDNQRPSFATTTVSSVLLSLPFQILKCVLEHYELTARLGPETVASIMRQVVAERETRRTKALNARGVSQAGNEGDSRLIQNLFWSEFVEASPQQRAGFRLARRGREMDTPPSSGACSERNK